MFLWMPIRFVFDWYDKLEQWHAFCHNDHEATGIGLLTAAEHLDTRVGMEESVKKALGSEPYDNDWYVLMFMWDDTYTSTVYLQDGHPIIRRGSSEVTWKTVDKDGHLPQYFDIDFDDMRNAQPGVYGSIRHMYGTMPQYASPIFKGIGSGRFS